MYHRFRQPRPPPSNPCTHFPKAALIWCRSKTGPFPMAAITSELRVSKPNRRRRVRHKIQTPAYATFTTESQGAMLDLYEIVDISEEGVAIHCPKQLDKDREISLCLDLAECPEQIFTTGKVIWSNGLGRVGMHFTELPAESLFRLREWLFLNAMAGVANADAIVLAQSIARHVPPKPSYTDTLAAVTAVQREAEGLGADLPAVLQLVATRAQSLVRASGAAIALSTEDPEFMECRATSGPDAPPVGARLQVGSGFSGECVKTGQTLRCDDTEVDSRVDRERCRALGLRSILAVPLRSGEKSVGILEVFAAHPNVFTDNDNDVLQRLAEIVLAAVNRTTRAADLPEVTESKSASFTPLGSVLFAAADEENQKASSDNPIHGIRLPKSHLVLLLCCLAIVAGVLGYLSAPLLQAKFEQHSHPHLQTVLASTSAPKTEVAKPEMPSAASQVSKLEDMPLDQLRPLANGGDPAAQFALGLRFQGNEINGVDQNEAEKEAARWFTRSAENGYVAAQSKLGFLYSDGRGVPKDLNKAYLWTMIACDHPDSAAKDPAVNLSKGWAQHLHSQLTRDQATTIERQAQQWLQQHDRTKPSAN